MSSQNFRRAQLGFDLDSQVSGGPNLASIWIPMFPAGPTWLRFEPAPPPPRRNRGKFSQNESLLPRHQVKHADEVGNIDLPVSVQVSRGIILALCHQVKNAHGIGNVNLAVIIEVTRSSR